MGIGRGEQIDWGGGPIEKEKKKGRDRANKRRKHGAQIIKRRRENGAMNCGGKSMWKEVRTQKRVRSLASNVIFVNRWNAPKLAWLKPSVYCNASHIFLTQSRLTNFFIINHNGWTQCQVKSFVLKEQKLIFTVGKKCFDAIPFFFF